MWDWITSRPQYCLKIGVHDLAWAEVHRNWRGRPRYQCIVSALPEGIVRLSPLEQNVLSPHELESHIRAIAGSATTQAPGRSSTPGVPRAATVILPDLAVRLAVVRLQDLPWSSEERDALVRWRLGQEQLLSLSGAKVFSQVLSEPAASGDGPCTVLAVVVQESVLAQYETVCEAAGLIPQFTQDYRAVVQEVTRLTPTIVELIVHAQPSGAYRLDNLGGCAALSADFGQQVGAEITVDALVPFAAGLLVSARQRHRKVQVA